ncbi:MAG: curli assembly protein CsgF [Alphaproteobacteria bacterium]|nr:curli assembly protein CsgF [Alphaproteobacteria bacterium]
MKTLSRQYYTHYIRALTAALCCSTAIAGSASASTLVFEGNNGAIFNTAPPSGQALMLASTNKPKNDPRAGSSTIPTTSSGELVQQSVLNQISNEINQQIFNSSNASGTFDLGNSRTISYVRTGGNIVITIFDPSKGPTVITVPDV